ncbi:Methyltransferase type 12 [Pseudarthrobacter chlorophenolicus A6]|uniref:Methyltransferase type 12 n=1 Tax=Pseudarthrobacter chlorophenolicus (strain ATCC 700700 / DSM 12829 / CIP 107037 / JCM 12360 / KCTC 9906 / NCIMB 13794 / A6) TaxID=452863 RepID=B8HAG5_PSECP|nr:class I SAM-dependent methyltransferase [Pseudarthrobacter chlorophenolicus]ACL38426.1 Methyltransferase type 12 [Pseudarthrobacter chlorophenolicus A6]SDQ49067.1 Methyltransferase domain-containing protein [Pseudarthrobacter chlorophenolicus]
MSDSPIAVDWETARATNRDNWEDRVPLHEEAYGIGALDDPGYLTPVVRADLEALAPYVPDGTVAGLDVCHLQCHIGTDTVSLARAGARVTGLDFSPSALASAAGLAEKLGQEVAWVEADVLQARAAVSGDFDLVYTSIGTITWLPDLAQWASQVAELLKPGGTFYIRDGHPALYAVDEDAEGLQLRYPYFNRGEAQVWDEESTYVGDGKVAHSRTYQWAHPLSDILNSLIGAGLQVLRLDEGTTLPWKFSPRMVDVPDGYAWPEAERDLVPCTYTVVARKPQA